MNRHRRFYAELEDNIGEDEDDEYYEEEEEVNNNNNNYDEDEYYDEEGEDEAYEDNVAGVAANGAGLTGKEADYDVLQVCLPEMQSLWAAQSPGQAMDELAAVRALRENEYSAETSVALLLTAVRSAEGKRAMDDKAKATTAATSAKEATTTTTTAPEQQQQQPHSTGAKTLRITTTSAASRVTKSPQESAMPTNNATATTTQPVTEAASSKAAPSNTTSSSKAAAANKAQRASHAAPASDKPDCTFVIAGHVDAGKSTTLGHMLLLLGKVSLDEVERNERNARHYHKESFKYAWLLDQSEEERRRGVTIDAGSFSFDTARRRVHVLDAPGHKDYVLSMISSATQADAALLVVTAATSEFESGLAHGTREHLLVLKTLGVGSIIVVVNKMDTVGYAQARYDHVVAELQSLLKQLRMKEGSVTGFCPVSGMTGCNLTEREAVAAANANAESESATPPCMPWYTGPCLLEMMDECPLESRLLHGPLRLSLQDVQNNVLYCKVESGTVHRGETVQFVPCNVKVAVKRMDRATTTATVTSAQAGDTVELSTSSSLVGLTPGCIGCDPAAGLLPCATDFEAHVQTFETLTQSILPGALFTMVVHALTVPVRVVALVSKMDAKTGRWSKGMVKVIPPATQAIVVFRAEHAVALEAAENCRALGRFVLRQKGETVAGGLVKRMIVN